MFDSMVGFADGDPTTLDVRAVRQTDLHRHPDALEIVYVLRGDLHARVSCEAFDLATGDFAVLNRGDAHALRGSVDNVTAILHVDLSAYVEVDPYVEHIIFACESFDLVRYRRQEAMLRGLILSVIDSLRADGDAGVEPSRELMRVLCTGYSLENYYNRGTNLTGGRRDKIQRIIQFLRAHATARDVLGMLADDQHYSKSYVSHFFKEACGVSFSDLLGYLRVAHAENLLLSTKATMLEISAQCGFSDVKYFTRTFVDWFHESPADYRRQHRPATQQDSDTAPVEDAVIDQLIRDHRQQIASPAEGPRLSVTPLLLKNLGSRLDLYDAVRTQHDAAQTRPPKRPRGSVGGTDHLVPIRVTQADLDEGFLIDGLASFGQIDAKPCLVIEYTTAGATTELLAAVAEAVSSDQPVIWLTYSGFHQRSGVDALVGTAKSEHGITVQPIMMP